jgi:Fibronectin type III domain
MTLMRHFLMAHTNQTAPSHRMTSSTPWFWQVLVITTCIWLGLVSEGLATHAVSPTSLTFYAVQGTTTTPPTYPAKKTLTFTKVPTTKATLTASDNATWLTVSPTSQSVTTRGTITVAVVNLSGRTAGTYKATITVKEGTWFTKTIPVTLIISPPSGGGGGTTSSATLAWNAVTGTVSGYNVYVRNEPGTYTRTIAAGTGTSIIVNSLPVGNTYYFHVKAYNSAGEGASSNVVSKTIP